MNLESWLVRHPYLGPLANLHGRIESVLGRFPDATIALPEWDAYVNDFETGIPLLRSAHLELDLKPAGSILKALVERLALDSETIAERCQTLQSELNQQRDAPSVAVAALLDRAEFQSRCPDLLWFLAWIALSRYLHQIISAFDKWRDDEKWRRSYCPTCGSNPAMAQLLGAEQGRRRFLCCGRCGTRWQYRRTGCPFCTIPDDHSLRVLTVEGEAGLRIDYCEHCRGYLKTYEGEEDENVLLANWTSVHLDILAHERTLKSFAEPIYDFGCIQSNDVA